MKIIKLVKHRFIHADLNKNPPSEDMLRSIEKNVCFYAFGISIPQVTSFILMAIFFSMSIRVTNEHLSVAFLLFGTSSLAFLIIAAFEIYGTDNKIQPIDDKETVSLANILRECESNNVKAYAEKIKEMGREYRRFEYEAIKSHAELEVKGVKKAKEALYGKQYCSKKENENV